MRRMLRGAVTAMLLSAGLLSAGAGPARAESALWTLTASPLAVSTGATTTFTLTATNEDPVAALSSSSEIGCVVLDVPSSFTVAGAGVVGSNAGDSWHVDRIEGNRVFVHVDSGGDRLAFLNWVRFTVTATATSVGSLAWAANAYRREDCTGSGALLGVPPIVVVAGATVTPSPVPTPAPTAAPTATPRPTPTPIITLPSLPVPSLPVPAPTATPRPSPSASAQPAPTPAPRATAASASPAASPEEVAPDASPVGPSASARAEVPASGPVEAPPAPAGPVAQTGPSIVLPESNAPAAPAVASALLASVSLYAVPAAAIAVPGVIILVWVALQTVGALAWIPAVRRLRGRDASPYA